MAYRKTFEQRMAELAAMRDAIKKDFLDDLAASTALEIDGTPVVTVRQRACKLCNKTGHNARTCPERFKVKKR